MFVCFRILPLGLLLILLPALKLLNGRLTAVFPVLSSVGGMTTQPSQNNKCKEIRPCKHHFKNNTTKIKATY